MLIKIVAVIAGLIVGMLATAGIEGIGHQIYPPPTGLASAKPEVVKELVKEYLKTAPLGSLLMVNLAHAIGAFLAGVVATLIHNPNSRNLALTCGIILTVAGILNLVLIPHPMWFAILDVLLYIPFALMGNKIVLLVTQKNKLI